MAGVTASTTEGLNDVPSVEPLIASNRLGSFDIGTPAAVAAGGTRFWSSLASVLSRTVVYTAVPTE